MSSKTRIRYQKLLARWAKPGHAGLTPNGYYLRVASVTFMAARESSKKEANHV